MAKKREVTLTGPLFEPSHLDRFRAHVAADMAREAKRLEAAVKAVTPVGRTGKLQAAVTAKATMSKGKASRVTIAVNADKATRDTTPGDAPKRYGKVPYGVFVEHRTGFISETIAKEHVGLLRALTDSVTRFAKNEHKRQAQGKGAA